MLGPGIYCLPPPPPKKKNKKKKKNMYISGISGIPQKKTFEILATPKISPLCTLTSRKYPKFDRNYSLNQSSYMLTPQNMHKIFILKNIYLFETPKHIEIQDFDPPPQKKKKKKKKWPEPTYVCKYHHPGVRVLIFVLSLHLYQCFVYASIEGSGESAHMRRLA